MRNVRWQRLEVLPESELRFRIGGEQAIATV